MKARDDATTEFHRFYNDLKKIKDNSLNGFEEFIMVKKEFQVRILIMF